MLSTRLDAAADEDAAGKRGRTDMAGPDLSVAIISRTLEITSALTTFLPGQS
jgi:hypothetical protein